MNISLTWANYALIVSVCFVIYYLTVLFLYRKTSHPFSPRKAPDESQGLPLAFSNQEKVPERQTGLNLFGEETEEDFFTADDPVDLTPDTEGFKDEVEAFTSSCGMTIGKETLLKGLKRILQKYPSLIAGDSHYELNQLIALLSETHCSLQLSAEELNGLWKG